jgi:hypothetical protein
MTPTPLSRNQLETALDLVDEARDRALEIRETYPSIAEAMTAAAMGVAESVIVIMESRLPGRPFIVPKNSAGLVWRYRAGRSRASKRRTSSEHRS